MSNVVRLLDYREPEEVEPDHEPTDNDVWVDTGYSRNLPSLPPVESTSVTDEWGDEPIEKIERCPGVLPWGYGDGSDLPF
jgi:hypothetical protein